MTYGDPYYEHLRARLTHSFTVGVVVGALGSTAAWILAWALLPIP